VQIAQEMDDYQYVPDADRPRTLLGRGSFGITYMMREVATGRLVAIKYLAGKILLLLRPEGVRFIEILVQLLQGGCHLQHAHAFAIH